MRVQQILFFSVQRNKSVFVRFFEVRQLGKHLFNFVEFQFSLFDRTAFSNQVLLQQTLITFVFETEQ